MEKTRSRTFGEARSRGPQTGGAPSRLQSVEPELRANVGIDHIRKPNQTATPKAVELRLITAVEQNMAELSHASLDESALEQAEFSERTVGAVSAKRDK